MNNFEIITREMTEIKEENSRIKNMITKLAQSSGLQGEVLAELATGITDVVAGEIKIQIKEEMATRTKEIQTNVLSTIDGTISTKIKDEVNRRGLNGREISRLSKQRNKRMAQLLGGCKTDRYLIFSAFYFSQMRKEYNAKFDVCAYGDIDADKFDEALEFFKNFTVSDTYFDWCIKTLHKNYMDNEIESIKKLNAYKRYFNIG